MCSVYLYTLSLLPDELQLIDFLLHIRWWSCLQKRFTTQVSSTRPASFTTGRKKANRELRARRARASSFCPSHSFGGHFCNSAILSGSNILWNNFSKFLVSVYQSTCLGVVLVSSVAGVCSPLGLVIACASRGTAPQKWRQIILIALWWPAAV